MDFSDAAAMLGVLAGLIVAINVIVWTTERSGADPQNYAYANVLGLPAFFIGQAALMVGISTVLHYAPNEIDLTRWFTIMVACFSVVIISIHTVEGLDAGFGLARGVRLAQVDREISRLRRVLILWPRVGAGRSVWKALAWDYSVAVLQASIAALAVFAVRAVATDDLSGLPKQFVVVVLVAGLVTFFVGGGVVLIVRSFVTQRLGIGFSLCVAFSLFVIAIPIGTVLALRGSGGVQTSNILLALGFYVIVFWIPGRIIVSWVRTDSTTLTSVGLRWFIRNSLLLELRKQRKIRDGVSGRTTEGSGWLATRTRAIVAWYRASTGQLSTD